MRLIDFQREIDIALRFSAKKVAEDVVYQLTRQQWQTYVRWESKDVLDIGVRRTPHDVWEKFYFNLTVEGRTIDAALLQQMYDEIVTWFTNIKTEAQP